MTSSPNNLIWIDLEMTGLDTDNDYIIEVATIITDTQLNILAEGPIIAVYRDEEILLTMDEWNTRHHNQSGLGMNSTAHDPACICIEAGRNIKG